MFDCVLCFDQFRTLPDALVQTSQLGSIYNLHISISCSISFHFSIPLTITTEQPQLQESVEVGEVEEESFFLFGENP